MRTETPPGPVRRTKVRFGIIAFLFFLTTVNYADRATLSIAGNDMSKALGFDAVVLGYLFSAFGWAYVAGQIPGGWLLDRFGSKSVYGWSIGLWSLLTFLQGFGGMLPLAMAVPGLFVLRFLLGVAEAPSFPANSRIVASWFPTAERGTASAIFNSAQYFATVLFAPIMGLITHSLGWQWVFWFMGALGLVLTAFWPGIMHQPREHPRANQAEIDHIAQGGGLVDLDRTSGSGPAVRWAALGQLLRNRMMLGIYLANTASMC